LSELATWDRWSNVVSINWLMRLKITETQSYGGPRSDTILSWLHAGYREPQSTPQSAHSEFLGPGTTAVALRAPSRQDRKGNHLERNVETESIRIDRPQHQP
jgi:hypothetical protein